MFGALKRVCSVGIVKVEAVRTPVSKRIMDVAAALLLIAMLGPVMVVVAVLVRLILGSPVLFRQERGGLGGEKFEIIKFRTMTDDLDAQGELASDSERRHPFGDRLRATSLDELPTLFNLLRGDISLVGPRPLMAKYLERYSPEQARRHCVQPGITGLAQTSGRNQLNWDEKFALDLRYVEQRSFALDVRLLLRTLATVLGRSGADGIDHTTEFIGADFEVGRDPECR